MKHGAIGMICRILVVSLMFLSFQSVHASMIGTAQVAAGAQPDRAGVVSVIERSDISQRLQALGVDPQSAKDRVGAMTDDEVQALNGKLNSLPAGGISNWWIGTIVVAIILVAVFGWYRT